MLDDLAIVRTTSTATIKEVVVTEGEMRVVLKKAASFNVTRTQTSSPKKSIKKRHEIEGDDDHEFRNNYKQSVIENKNDYWRRMCWCEVQKRRKSRTTITSIDLRSRFERYDRWERKDFRRVDWKTFYDEMRLEKPSKPDEGVGNPKFLGGVFVIMFMLFYCLISSL
jgi:hypothetical protein